MWTWCEEVFAGATQIFDYWHAAQHLQDALKSAYGEGSPQAQRHFERLREVLKEEQKGIDKVLRSLQRLARKQQFPLASRVVAYTGVIEHEAGFHS